jgi:hypothetical protein
VCLGIHFAPQDLFGAGDCKRSDLVAQLFSRARDTSCWMSALAAAFSRSPSALALALASSITWPARFSACARISAARPRALAISVPACAADCSSDFLPCSAAASPSAIVFCRASMARSSGGQTKALVNQMKAAKTIACATKVKVMFMLRPPPGTWR